MRPRLLLCCLALAPASWAEAPFLQGDLPSAAAAGLLDNGKRLEAEAQAKEAFKRMEEAMGASHWRTALARRNWAVALWHLGEAPIHHLELSRAQLALALGEGDGRVLRLDLDLAGLHLGLDEPEPALARLRGAAKRAHLALQQGGPSPEFKALLLEALEGMADFKEVEELPQAWQEHFREPRESLELSLILGRVALRAWRLEEARGHARAAMEKALALHGQGHPFLAPSQEAMARVLETQGGFEEALRLRQAALEGRRRSAGLLQRSSLGQHRRVYDLLVEMRRDEEAETLKLKAEKIWSQARK